MLTTSAHSLKAARRRARLPRIAVTLTCVVLILAGLRATITRGGAHPLPTASSATRPDYASQALAQAFARAYLSWRDDASVDRALQQLAPSVEPPAVPSDTTQSVRWTQVVDVAAGRSGLSIVTVQASTTGGTYSLAVPIRPGRHGTRSVAAPPAIVGALPRAPETSRGGREPQIDDRALTTVIHRTLRNYLAAEANDLAADLHPSAVVVTPDARLRLLRADPPTWAVVNRRAAVLVHARTPSGVELALRYELAVVRRAGRWLVLAINTNPSTEATS